MIERAAGAGQVKSWQARMEQALAQRLPPLDAEPTRLHAAMRQCVLNGGERLRPVLLFATARALGLAEQQVEAAACAIELAHAYAQVHDDLPALRDGGRNGGSTACHEAYDEGTAVLAGDALQSLAFQLLAGDGALPSSAEVRLRLIALLAAAIGAGGLTGGQSLDATAHGQTLSASELEATYARRSGALIRASVLMAAACAPQVGPGVSESLAGFATALALGVRIQKDPGYRAACGAAAASARLRQLHDEALAALSALGAAAQPLRELAAWRLAGSAA